MSFLVSYHNELQRLYSAAIALNNMGVSLLEKHMYHASTEALNGAAELMRSVSQLLSDLDDKSKGSVDAILQECDFNKTAKLLQKMHRNLAHHYQLCWQPNDYLVETITEDSDLLLSKSTRKVKPIRIEGCSLPEVISRDPNLDSALILYNLGCVHQCRALAISTSAASTERRRHFWINAKKLFCFTLTLLENTLADDKDDQFNHHGSKVIPLSILVLRNLAWASFALGNDAEEQNYLDRAGVLERYYAETTFFNKILVSHTAAAA